MTFDKWNIKPLPISFSPWMPMEGLSKQIAALMSDGIESSVATHIHKEDNLNA